MKRVRIIITGEVQGVFFRSFIRKEAETLGVTGWVRNNPDLSVEAVFEGEEKAVEELVQHCQKGSLGAHVENVTVEEEVYTGSFTRFTVR